MIGHLSGLWFIVPCAILYFAVVVTIHSCLSVASHADRNLAGKPGRK